MKQSVYTLILSFFVGTIMFFSNPGMAARDDRSYSSQKLEYLPPLKFKQPITEAQTIVDIQIPSASGTIRWYLAQAIGIHTATPSSPPFALRFCIPDVPDGQSPNKITANWQGGLKTAKQKLTQNRDLCKGIKFIAGHYPFGLHKYASNDIKYIVLVRDPIEQALSDTNFAFQRGYINANEATSYLLDDRLDNLQTRMLAGEEFMQGPCTEEVLQRAISNIEKHFLLAGVTEDTNGFLQALASIQGWGPIALTKVQVTGDKAINSVSPYLRSQLLAKNSFDVQLHSWLKLRWNQWKLDNIDYAASKNLPEPGRVLCLTSEFAQTRMPRYMSVADIYEHNQNKSDEIIQMDQDYPSHPSYKRL